MRGSKTLIKTEEVGTAGLEPAKSSEELTLVMHLAALHAERVLWRTVAEGFGATGPRPTNGRVLELVSSTCTAAVREFVLCQKKAQVVEMPRRASIFDVLRFPDNEEGA